jgi:hypothetical protein
MTRNLALDLLKIVLAMMVVGLHAGFLNETSPLAFNLTCNGLFRLAVPMFLLINGFYFQHAVVHGRHWAWMKRVFILYIVWMPIYAYYWLEPLTSRSAIKNDISSIIFGYYHLWYIAGMIGAGLIMMVVRLASSKKLFFYAVVAFACGVAIQYVGTYHLTGNLYVDSHLSRTPMHRNAVLFSFPFFAMGYLIARESIQTKVSLRNAGFAAAIGLLGVLAESYFNYRHIQGWNAVDNLAFLMIACPAIFLLVSNVKIKGQGKQLALYSSSIYFIHVLIMRSLQSNWAMGGTLAAVATIILSIPASALIILANKRLKVLL